ncbi:MAG: hypothetical protein M1444_03145 [Patescibacteria group bacterium]|nr:hypothetical protein [Patescibacteria group bacterium]
MKNNGSNLQYADFHRKAALYWNSLANERQFELIKQLLAIGALILTLSVTIIGFFKGNVNFQSQPISSTFLVLSWIFIILSIFFGLKQLSIDSLYFNYLSNDESKRQAIFEQLSLEDATGRVKKMQPTVSKSDEKWLLLQETFFLIGIIFISIGAIFILSIKS